MSNYILSCCSTADLTQEHFESRDIHYICFHYAIDGVEYADDLGRSMPFDEFYARVKRGADTRTSQVNISEYVDYFSAFLEQGLDVVHVSLSSGISGTIVATEVKSIPGYTIDENTRTQTVVVNPNDTQTLHFYNTPIGGVEIIKVNEDNHSERIPNTTFEIRKVDDALVDTVTTDKNGRVFVALEDGSYYAKEVTSNKSFRLDDTPHYFEIKDGKHVTLQVTNKKLSGIVIHKIDSVTGEGIYGVKFVLYDVNKKPIGEYTSDDEGYIYIDESPGGLSGRFYLRELEAAPGYTLDKQYKTVYVSPGKTVEIEWENTAVTGQIQIYKYAAEYNGSAAAPCLPQRRGHRW